VLVLEAPKGAGWKEGVQAVVAELLTSGRELTVRAGRARSLGELEQELNAELVSSGASAGVSVTRDGTDATALLCRRGVTPCERVEVSVAEGELSRSRLALAVVERLRPLELPVQPEPAAPAVAPPAPPRPKPPPPAPPTPPRSEPARAWAGGGAVASSGTSRPLVWLAASLRVAVAGPWGLELGIGGTPLRGRAESYAGSLSLSAFQAVGFVTLEPLSKRAFGFGLGLGGGAVRLEESASPAAGFDGFSRHATVGVVSARARLFRRFGPLYAGVSVDPGMLVPPVRVEAGTATVLRFGRPWVSVQLSLGVDL
jgi:hypothetical protein